MTSDDMRAATQFIEDAPRDRLLRKMQAVKRRNVKKAEEEEEKQRAEMPRKERARFIELREEFVEKWLEFSARDTATLDTATVKELELLLLQKARRRRRWVQALTLWPVNVGLLLPFYHGFFISSIALAACYFLLWCIFANHRGGFSPEDDPTFYAKCWEYIKLWRKYGVTEEISDEKQ